MTDITTNANSLRKRRRRWLQFSLRSLLIFVTLIAVLLTWFIVPLARRHAVVERIKALGGDVRFAPTPAEESWLTRTLREYLPQDWFDDVGTIHFSSSNATDAILVGFESFTQLRELYLYDSPVTDDGLSHLEGLTQLQLLFLGGKQMQVTDAGLAHLQGLAQLEALYLYDTPVTDAGLAHLQRLTQLETLILGATQISDAGLVHLQGLSQLHNLTLSATQITDAGLAHLQGLSQLRQLGLEGTQVTTEGVAQFRKTLPNCTTSGPELPHEK